MRLSTITNWAYGATVFLTVASGTTMLLASDAHDKERAAVEQRFALDHTTSRVREDIFQLTSLAREYVITDDDSYLVNYSSVLEEHGTVEERLASVEDAGAGHEELALLADSIEWADMLRDEQAAALAAQRADNYNLAQGILFGAQYQRHLNQLSDKVDNFQSVLNQRTEIEISEAKGAAIWWRTMSEIMLGITGFLFLCVLFFILKRRVLKPVVRLSDVVKRLAAQDYTVEPFEYDRIDEIGDMADAISIFRENGLERQRLERERAADRTTRDRLTRMTQRMQGCESREGLAAVIKQFVPKIVPRFAGALYLLDDERNALEKACDWQSPEHSRDDFPPNACWALRRGVMHLSSGAEIDVPCEHLNADIDPATQLICLPLIMQRQAIGLLYFEQKDSVDTGVDEASEIYLKVLAENIGLAIANIRLRDALKAKAMEDGLTGLANRHRLSEVLADGVDGLTAKDEPLSCIMLDVDHFKHFNDQFGHEAGDAVLRAVGDVLKNSTRDGALSYRYGGEEFLLFLPDVSKELAAERAEQIRARIAELELIHEGVKLGQITASFGVSTSPDDCDPATLVQTADAALLRAKGAGRNRVEVAKSRSMRDAA